MALIQPFKAVRPTQDKVAFVASRSYEAYAHQELQSELKYNPFSFLHILDPGFSLEELAHTERFQLVYDRYCEFLTDHIFQQDKAACFYIYKIVKDGFTSIGLFCTCSVADYQSNLIKKHEGTLEHRKAILVDYIHTVGFNAEPVLIAYPDHKEVNEIFQREMLHKPEYDFIIGDGTSHTLWKIANPETIKKLQGTFASIDAMYIADGHHRSASSCLTAQKMKAENPSHTGNEAYNFFMTCLIPESQIAIQGYDRMVTDLKDYTKNEFLEQLNRYFYVDKQENNLCPTPKKHSFSMYMAGVWYILQLRKESCVFADALSTLDIQILYKTILEPLLGISDLRNDPRIAYASSTAHHISMQSRIDQGEFAVGFRLAPITMEDLKAVADAGLVMPPKSTYIEPKLLTGLTIYELCHDRKIMSSCPSV